MESTSLLSLTISGREEANKNGGKRKKNPMGGRPAKTRERVKMLLCTVYVCVFFLTRSNSNFIPMQFRAFFFFHSSFSELQRDEMIFFARRVVLAGQACALCRGKKALFFRSAETFEAVQKLEF
jgi:hypothetical protein